MVSIVTKVNGNTVSATEFNQLPDELENVVTASGQTPAAGTVDQVAKGIVDISANSDYYTDSGAADAYVLTAVAPNKSPTSYRNGMLIRWRTSNANTGASTINVATLGVKNIKLEDGSTDPSAGDISDSLENQGVYDGTSFRLIKGGRNEFDNIQINNKLNTQRVSVAISSGAIAYSASFISITGEGATTDTLTDITGGVLGDRLKIYCGTGYDITIEHNATKINLATNTDIVMQNGDALDLVCIGSNIWLETSRAISTSKYMQLVTSATASNDATIDLTWTNDSDYSNYAVYFESIAPATDSVRLYMRISTDGGSSWESGASDYTFSIKTIPSTGAESSYLEEDEAFISITDDSAGLELGNAANENLCGKIEFISPDNSTYKRFFGQANYASDGTPFLVQTLVCGTYKAATSAINGLRFYMSSGNITSGIFRVYRY